MNHDQQISRIKLAAALLDYDQPELQNGFQDQASKAQHSALLSPYRHLLLHQNTTTTSSSIESPEFDRNEGYFSSSYAAVEPGSYSAPSSASEGSLPAISPRPFSQLSINDRLDKGITEEEQEVLQQGEEVNQEWGLGDYLSQLGSGSKSQVTSPITVHDDASQFSFPTSPQIASWLLTDDEGNNVSASADETRSMPDLDRPRVDSTASTSALDSVLKPTRKIRVLERKVGVPAIRPRAQSLSTPTAFGLSLPSFTELPSLDQLQRQTSTSSDPLLSPDSDGRLSSFSLARHSEQVAAKSNRGSLGSAAIPSSSGRLSRLVTPSPINSSPSAASPIASTSQLDPADEPRPHSSLSNHQLSSTSFTSRFDPVFMAQQKAELDKDRPQFVNPLAGNPPKVVLMPAPLSGRPLSLPPNPKEEGPEPLNEDELEEEALKFERPAGALYGRSLMDVLEEKKKAQKAQQKSFVPGQDGRRSMMDWKDSSLAAQESLSKQKDVGIEASRSKAHLSVFGRDLHYERDLELLKAMEEEEAKEREEEDRKESEIWEKVRIKEEEKRKGKGTRLVKGDRKKSQDFETTASRALASTSSDPYSNFSLTSEYTRAPSLTLPRLETEPMSTSDEWYPPADRNSSPTRSSSSEAELYHERRPTHEYSRPHYQRQASSNTQALDLRNAVMQGTMSPEQAAVQARYMGIGSGSSGSAVQDEVDQRPMGERIANDLSQKQPPRWQLDFGVFNQDEDDDEDNDDATNEDGTVQNANDSDSDDQPLGMKINGGSEDEDVPLALKAAANQPREGAGGEDEDDVPLGLTPASQMKNQYLQEAAIHEQRQQRQYVAAAQNQMYLQAQAQQSAAYFAMQQHLAANGSGQIVPGMGGTPGSVEKWRQSIGKQ